MGYRVTKWLNSAKSAGARICRWSGRHAVLLALVLLLSTIIVPRKVQGQLPSPCCAMLAEGLGTINITLGSVIAAGLQAINVILNNTNNFLQTDVWPQKAIAQALGMSGQIGRILRADRLNSASSDRHGDATKSETARGHSYVRNVWNHRPGFEHYGKLCRPCIRWCLLPRMRLPQSAI